MFVTRSIEHKKSHWQKQLSTPDVLLGIMSLKWQNLQTNKKRYSKWKKAKPKVWYTYDVYEIFKTPHLLVHLLPEFQYQRNPLSLPPPSLSKWKSIEEENIIQGWVLYIIMSFLQIGFRFQYHFINLAWLFFDFFSFSWSLTICFSVALYSCVCSFPKISKNVFYL